MEIDPIDDLRLYLFKKIIDKICTKKDTQYEFMNDIDKNQQNIEIINKYKDVIFKLFPYHHSGNLMANKKIVSQMIKHMIKTLDHINVKFDKKIINITIDGKQTTKNLFMIKNIN